VNASPNRCLQPTLGDPRAAEAQSCQFAAALSALLCAVSFATDSLAQAPTGECPPGTPRVYVDKDANIELNGKRVTSTELSDELSAMDPKPTHACYSHGLQAGNPIPGALSAMRTLVALEIEIVLYTDNTFTTVDPEN
jgi:hypothetical protein